MLESLTSLSPAQWVLFALIGIVTGVINTLAGSGSLITLPLFITLCGLDVGMANGTNRIGAMLQSVWGAGAYWKSRPEAFRHSHWVTVPGTVGALVGAWIATQIDHRYLEWAIAGLMLFMLVVLIVNPTRWIKESTQDLKRMKNWKCIVSFLAIGFYGGFIQAGVGIFLLAGLVLMASYSLRDANAIKLTIVSAISVPAIAIFAWKQEIHYFFGFAMALFQVFGAMIGVWLSKRMPHINRWIYGLMIAMLIVVAIQFIARIVGAQ